MKVICIKDVRSIDISYVNQEYQFYSVGIDDIIFKKNKSYTIDPYYIVSDYIRIVDEFENRIFFSKENKDELYTYPYYYNYFMLEDEYRNMMICKLID